MRAAAGLSALVITADGAAMGHRASLMERAQFGRALGFWPQMPPLYPLMMALFHRSTFSWTLAGTAVSVLFGSLALLPLYDLAKSLAGERVAAATGLLFAFMPQVAILGGEVMTESLFFFFFLSWMALLWRGTRLRVAEAAAPAAQAREPYWTIFLLVGLAGAAAYLTRPEGIYTLPGTLGWCVLTARRQVLKIAVGAGCFLIVFMILIYPYLLWVRSFTGRWTFSANPFARNIIARLQGKPVVSEMPENYTAFVDPELEYRAGREQAKYGKLGGSLIMIARDSVKVCFYAFAPLGIVGVVLAWRRGLPRSGILFLLLMIVGYGTPTIVGLMFDQPFGFRYITPPCLFAMPFMALATMEALRLLRSIPWLSVALSVAVLAAMTVKTVRPRRRDKLGVKESGLWIRSNFGAGRRIGFMDRRADFYAQAQGLLLPPHFKDTPGDLEFLTVRMPDLHLFEPDYLEKLEERWKEVRRFGNDRVYAPK